MLAAKDIYKNYFHKILVIDIETVSNVKQLDELSPALQKQWSHKVINLNKYNPSEDTDAALFEQKAGIYAEFGKVISICVGRFVWEEDGMNLRIKSYSGHDEKEVLESFMSDIILFENKNLHPIFCGHNIKEFDLPYMCRRSLIHGLSLPKSLQLSGVKSWNNPHIDTLELWRFGDYKHFVSLDLLATIFQVPSSKSTMDGSMVSGAYWNDNNLEGINTYCMADVAVTAQVYMKMKNTHLPLEITYL